jgi:hypothetical protein
MIDMNQSIESIMEECDRIAFNEFNGESQYAYSYARNMKRNTKYHDGWGKTASAAAKNKVSDGVVMGLNKDARTTKDRTERVNAAYDNTIDDKYRDKMRRTKQRDHGVTGNSNDRKRARRAANESSIFDDLLDLV